MAIKPPVAPTLGDYTPRANPYNLTEEEKLRLVAEMEAAERAKAGGSVLKQSLARAERQRSRPMQEGAGAIGNMLSYIAGGGLANETNRNMGMLAGQEARGETAQRDFVLQQAMAQQAAGEEQMRLEGLRAQDAAAMQLYGTNLDSYNQGLDRAQQESHFTRRLDFDQEEAQWQRFMDSDASSRAWADLGQRDRELAFRRGFDEKTWDAEHKLALRQQGHRESFDMLNFREGVRQFDVTDERQRSEFKDTMMLSYDQLRERVDAREAEALLRRELQDDAQVHEFEKMDLEALYKTRLEKIKGEYKAMENQTLGQEAIATGLKPLREEMQGVSLLTSAGTALAEALAPYAIDSGDPRAGKNIPAIGKGADNLLREIDYAIQSGDKGNLLEKLGGAVSDGTLNFDSDLVANAALEGNVDGQIIYAAMINLVNQSIRAGSGMEASKQVIQDYKNAMNVGGGRATEATLTSLNNFFKQTNDQTDVLLSGHHPQIIAQARANGMFEKLNTRMPLIDLNKYNLSDEGGPNMTTSQMTAEAAGSVGADLVEGTKPIHEARERTPPQTKQEALQTVSALQNAGQTVVENFLFPGLRAVPDAVRTVVGKGADYLENRAFEDAQAILEGSYDIGESNIEKAFDYGKTKGADWLKARGQEAVDAGKGMLEIGQNWYRAHQARTEEQRVERAYAVSGDRLKKAVSEQADKLGTEVEAAGQVLKVAASGFGNLLADSRKRIKAAADSSPEKLKIADEARFDLSQMYISGGLPEQSLRQGLQALYADLGMSRRASVARVEKDIEFFNRMKNQ